MRVRQGVRLEMGGVGAPRRDAGTRGDIPPLKKGKEGHTVTIETSTNGIVTDLAESNGVKKGAKAALSAYLMPVPTFAYIVRSTYERGGQDFLIDGIIRHAGEHKISAFEHKGYVARINSTAAYYKANRDCLKPEIWEELFMQPDRPISTKVKDEVPVQYKETAEVKNSLVANGCEIRAPEKEKKNGNLF